MTTLKSNTLTDSDITCLPEGQQRQHSRALGCICSPSATAVTVDTPHNPIGQKAAVVRRGDRLQARFMHSALQRPSSLPRSSSEGRVTREPFFSITTSPMTAAAHCILQLCKTEAILCYPAQRVMTLASPSRVPAGQRLPALPLCQGPIQQ